MALPLTSVPAKFVAGDTFSLVLTLSEFQAPAWNTVLYLNAHGLPTITLAGSDYGTQHLFLLSGGTTGSWPPATYSWVVRADNGGTQLIAASGKITVLANPATLTASSDVRSHARKTLDVLQALIEGRVVNGIENYSIDGRQIAKTPLKDLIALRDRYAGMVQMEEANAAGRSGLRSHLFRLN